MDNKLTNATYYFRPLLVLLVGVIITVLTGLRSNSNQKLVTDVCQEVASCMSSQPIIVTSNPNSTVPGLSVSPNTEPSTITTTVVSTSPAPGGQSNLQTTYTYSTQQGALQTNTASSVAGQPSTSPLQSNANVNSPSLSSNPMVESIQIPN